jgi:hypothetical protein
MEDLKKFTKRVFNKSKNPQPLPDSKPKTPPHGSLATKSHQATHKSGSEHKRQRDFADSDDEEDY